MIEEVYNEHNDFCIAVINERNKRILNCMLHIITNQTIISSFTN